VHRAFASAFGSGRRRQLPCAPIVGVTSERSKSAKSPGHCAAKACGLWAATREVEHLVVGQQKMSAGNLATSRLSTRWSRSATPFRATADGEAPETWPRSRSSSEHSREPAPGRSPRRSSGKAGSL
jgi:hypothetical protein